MRLQRSSNGLYIPIDIATSLGKGGEAHVYAIAHDPSLAAKVYGTEKATEERARKLAVMVAHSPDIPAGGDGHVPIAWPLDLLCDPDNPAVIRGFLERHRILHY